MNKLGVQIADYSLPEHVSAIAVLMRGYSSDVMGGGSPLSEPHCQQIAEKLQDFGYAVTALAFDGVTPVGLITAIKSFSTFKNSAVLNLHDVYVIPQQRGRGIASQLLTLIDKTAISMGCCKLTLEVLSNNESAKSLYRKFGFKPYTLIDGAGDARFWEKVFHDQL